MIVLECVGNGYNLKKFQLKFPNLCFVFRIIAEFADKPDEFNINCLDPLNRSALIAAIENENIELIRILLEANILVKDALLHAISEEYVEGVETLLYHEEESHETGKPYVSLIYCSYDKVFWLFFCSQMKLSLCLVMGSSG